jgi:hypothetical protein
MKNQFLVFILSVALLACNHDSRLPERSDLSATQIQKLRCNGFDPENVKYQNGQYLVDGDYLIGDEHLRTDLLIEKELSIDADYYHQLESRQSATYGNTAVKVSLENVGSIYYHVDPLLKVINNSSTYWYQAIKNATRDITNIPNCKIKFIEVSNVSAANLRFFLDSPNSSTRPSGWSQPDVGQACFPSNGNIGKYIGLKASSSVDKYRISLHELGHCLGLRHTCYSLEGIYESADATDFCGTNVNRFQIEGTPSPDCGSVMRPNEPPNNVLNSNDILSLQYLYPEAYSTPTIKSIAKVWNGFGYYVTIKLANAPTGQEPYSVRIGRYTLTSGTPVETKAYYRPNNAGTTFTFSVPNGTWRFRVFYRNHGNYYVGSNVVSISI